MEGTLTVDDEVAVADEGEGVVCASVAFGEHQLEAAGVVVGLGLECVARGGEQVDVGTGQVVDQTENGKRNPEGLTDRTGGKTENGERK